MPDALRSALFESPGTPLAVLGRLVAAMLLGGVVALVYRRTRDASEVSHSFTVTLVLLSILIAMVTQVIGDNVARAFSLVGALSIVRFRTVVRDTQDTAFVIFAVAVGMAVGASHPSVALSGIAVVAMAAWFMSRGAPAREPQDPYVLEVRVGVGHDAESLVKPALDAHARRRRLMSIATAKQGMAIEIAYRIELLTDQSAADLVKLLNRTDGVQGVSLQRTAIEG
ncbi:MAG TPA: DUF4956 domain-containing protein [Vicinamibacterales bacterium]|nr:DUF4956 domain-containing protein [Vicinamibacterales bacterium]